MNNLLTGGAMDQGTIAAYERCADDYARRRRPSRPTLAAAVAAAVPAGRVRVDLGCGPGLYGQVLGSPLVVLDASPAMVGLAVGRVPGVHGVQADLEALPFRTHAIHGAWASKSYQHLPADRLPLALADLHRALAVGAPAALTISRGDGTSVTGEHDDYPGRFFARWRPEHLADVAEGAGLDEISLEADGDWVHLRARRARSLADTVGADMRVLVCGLNPSLYAADAGVGFARPGNRFWPAAIAAGLVSRPRDPRHALRTHGVGLTDLVKRATAGAGDLTAAEYRHGHARVERLCAWLRPAMLCFVGLAGWRAAVDRHARPGFQPAELAGVPVYVMPSTSGRNATSTAELTEHLEAVAALAP